MQVARKPCFPRPCYFTPCAPPRCRVRRLIHEASHADVEFAAEPGCRRTRSTARSTCVVTPFWQTVVNRCSPNAPACRITSRGSVGCKFTSCTVRPSGAIRSTKAATSAGRPGRRARVEVEQPAVQQAAVVHVIRPAQHELYESLQDDRVSFLPVMDVPLCRNTLVMSNHVQPLQAGSIRLVRRICSG